MDFASNIYYGYIAKGDLIGAIDYVKHFPEQEELYNRFMAVFGQEQYVTYKVDAVLNEILLFYQQYYREVFYLCIGRENAEAGLRARLADFFGIEDEGTRLCDMEQGRISQTFQERGFHFLGGRTSGYYGPYVWQTTETRTYEVELPGGIQTYTVNLLDGFIVKSWMDFLSFGEMSSGGWTDCNGVINCIKSSYDFDSEDFRVSLLKHEAQHARDLAVDKDMASEDLEYRAKLVELIYSSERNRLEQFAQEADYADKSNGHSLASGRILDGFAQKLKLTPVEIVQLPNERVQAVARTLFEESGKRL